MRHMKEKYFGKLDDMGRLGSVLFLYTFLFLSCVPVVISDLPLWVAVALLAFLIGADFVGSLIVAPFYVYASAVVFFESNAVLAIFYFAALALYAIVFFIPDLLKAFAVLSGDEPLDRAKFNKSSVALFIFVLVLLVAYAFVRFNASRTISEPSSDTVVYVTPYGEKYHRENCTYMTGERTEMTISEAEDMDYTPCSRCRPDALILVEDNEQKVAIAVTICFSAAGAFVFFVCFKVKNGKKKHSLKQEQIKYLR